MDKQQLKQNILEAIKNEPAKKDIKKASLFGSYLHGEHTAESDVDLLVEFKPTAKVGFSVDFLGKRYWRRRKIFMKDNLIYLKRIWGSDIITIKI